MANNQHLLPAGKYNYEELHRKTYGPYNEGFWSPFKTQCRACGKEKEWKIAKNYSLSVQMQNSNWTWIADGTEDGLQTCSDECRALLEIAR